MLSIAANTLASRIALMGVLAVLSASALIGGGSYLVVRHHITASVADMVAVETANVALRVSHNLDAISSGMASLAANNIVANSLVDDMGRQTYLRPFLADFARITNVAGQLAVVDYRGRPLAPSEESAALVPQLPWLREVIADGAPVARLVHLDGTEHLVMVQPVVYANTGTAEGALVLAMPLGRLAARELAANAAGISHRLSFGNSFAPDLAVTPITARPPLAALKPAVVSEVDDALIAGPLREMSLTIVLVVLASTLIVGVTGLRMARAIATPLARLSQAAAAVDVSAGTPTFAEVTGGTAEVDLLSATIGAMVGRLTAAYHRLEHNSRALVRNAERIANVGSWRWHPVKGAMTWTDKVGEILGSQAGSQTLDRLLEAIDRQDRERVVSAFAALQSGAEITDLDVRLAGEGERFVRLNGRGAMVEGEHDAVFDGTLQDITEAVSTRRRIEETNRRLQAILNNIPVGLAILNLDRVLLLTNRVFNDIFGMPGEVVGQGADQLYGTREQYDDIGRRAYPLLLNGGIFSDTVLMRRRNGSDIWCSLTARLVDPAEPAFGAVWVLEDITNRKTAEDQLKEAHRLLEERTCDLERSNRELEQFAYVASHDLRQPLRQVSSYLTLLKRSALPKLEEDELSFLDFAVTGAKRMDGLILSLLEYSRVGRHDLPPADVPLDEVLREALQNLAIAAQEANAIITVPPSLPIVQGDWGELVRLFQNLIGNAIKYRRPGEAPVVKLDLAEEGARWIVTVADNGIGIAESDRERVFGIFQRLVSAEDYEGTGIGLAICRKIVDHHGGSIWLDSGAGGGSDFHVALPKRTAT